MLAAAGLATGAGDAPPKIRQETAADLVARGNAAYNAGRLGEALAAFEAGILQAPGSAIPRYNAAATSFQLKRYGEAHQLYLGARQRAGRARDGRCGRLR